MKPILMDESKTLAELAQDQTNGLGRLDCLKAECNEVANGAYTVTLVYPVSGQHFNDLRYGGIIKAKPNDMADLQLFRIKKISKPLNGKIEIQCQHITYDLAKTSVLPFTAIGAQAACAGIKSHLVNAELYPFDLISDSTNNTAQFNLQIPQSFRACLGGVSGSILDLFGGEYEWDNLTVRHHVHRGQDNGVRISYGKNLMDIKQEESIENMYTAVMPYVIQQNSESTTTILGNLQTIIPSDQPRVLNLDLSEYFDQDATITAAAIDERCRAYIEASNLDKPTVSIDVSFVALWQTEQYKNIAPLERVNLFDTVHVNFEPLNIEASARVTEYTYDILKERYVSIHLGNVRSTLAKTIAQTQEQITKETERALGFMETAIKKNTDMMTGVSGGHKYIVRDALGRIQEEYWLDTDSIETAVNIRRENLNGIAYSHNGINGPYVSAWMQDGSFTTELMNTLRIYAAQIIGGIIQDAQENNYWNLDTGEFRLAPGTLIGNQTAAQIAAAASSAALSDFVTATYNPDIADLQNQIDGNITTWYYTGTPTLANLPASQWTTTTDKDNHIGDLYYDKDTGYAYRFMLDNGSYVWTRISDEDISAAMAAASDAQDTADGKRRVFITQPVPPYDTGDLWCVGSSGDILTCTTAKATGGSYAAADWQKRNKYTDNTAVTNLDNNLNQQGIFNRLTNNGVTQGIYLSNSKLYINADYIKTGTLSADYINGGTLTMGGSNNADGKIYMNDAYGDRVGTWDNTGIKIHSSDNPSSNYMHFTNGALKMIGNNTEMGQLFFEDTSDGGIILESIYSDVKIRSNNWLYMIGGDDVQIGTGVDGGIDRINIQADSSGELYLSGTIVHISCSDDYGDTIQLNGREVGIGTTLLNVNGAQGIDYTFEDVGGNTFVVSNGIIVDVR